MRDKVRLSDVNCKMSQQRFLRDVVARHQAVSDKFGRCSNDTFTDDPPMHMCEAVGLQLAVMTWWRGGPGLGQALRSQKKRPEDEWLFQITHAGLSAALPQLESFGVPSRIIGAGSQLAQFIFHDDEFRSLWAALQQDKCPQTFVVRARDLMLERFDVHAARPNSQASGGGPALVLVQRDGCDGRLTSHSWHGQRGSCASPPARSSTVASSPFEPRGPWQPSAASDRTAWEPLKPPPAAVKRLSSRSTTKRASIVPAGEDSGSKPPEGVKPTARKSLARAAMNLRKSVKDHLPGLQVADDIPTPVDALTPGAGAVSTPVDLPTADDYLFFRRGSARRSTSSRVSCSGSPPPQRRAKRMSSFNNWMRCQDSKRKSDSKAEAMVEAVEVVETLASSDMRSLTSLKDTKLLAVRTADEIRKVMRSYDESQNQTLDRWSFIPVLSTLLRLPRGKMDDVEACRIWENLDVSERGFISFDDFYNWYCELVGISVVNDGNLITADDISPAEQMMRDRRPNLARTPCRSSVSSRNSTDWMQMAPAAWSTPNLARWSRKNSLPGRTIPTFLRRSCVSSGWTLTLTVLGK